MTTLTEETMRATQWLVESASGQLDAAIRESRERDRTVSVDLSSREDNGAMADRGSELLRLLVAETGATDGEFPRSEDGRTLELWRNGSYGERWTLSVRV